MMSSVSASPTQEADGRIRHHRIGRCFLSPLIDFLFIGGGLSFFVIPLVLWMPSLTPTDRRTTLAIYLVFNYAHFAASTVRLYSKPGNRKSFHFLCYSFPFVALAVTTVAILWPQDIGRHLWNLMRTWAPYHYAAQAYGLAVIYSFRSGCTLSKHDKSMLWWIAMLPFLRAFLNAPGAGLAWFVPAEWIASQPMVATFQSGLISLTSILIFVLPLWLWQRVQLPLMSLVLLVANGIWWVTLSYTDAWIWVTVFHSIQYLAIVVIYHVRDATADPSNQRSPGYHAAAFYVFSLLLGYCLFIGLPTAYGFVGLGGEETALMVAAAINIHHFVVDGYIWRSGKRPSVSRDGVEAVAQEA